MTKTEIEELRNLDLDYEALQARKSVLKQRLDEHRAEIGEADVEEAKQIKAEMAENRAKYTALKKNYETRSTENMTNDVLHFNETMERSDILATAEYRSAFFKKLQGKDLTEIESRSITSAANSGGAAIPTFTMDKIIGSLSEKGVFLGLVTVLNIPELISIPKEDVTNDASWIAEDSDSTVSDDSLTQITLSAYKLIRTVKITAKLSAMSVDAFETWIVNTMTKKMIKAIEAAIVSGNGSQRPTGIIPGTTWNESNSISYTDTASVTNQFDYDDFIDAESKIDEDYAGAAVYVMNAKTLATVRKLKDDNKRPLFERAVEDGFRGTLNGIPVKLSRNVPDDTILLGDFESGYVLNFTSPIEYSSSKEAGFMSGATIYRGLALLDGKPTGVAGAIVKMAITRYSAE